MEKGGYLVNTNWIKSKNILIVDDEPELLTLIKEIFERANYSNIATASSGKEALNLIHTKIPDMIICDVMMPGMDGLELLQEIRSFSKVPVVMLTARGEAQDRFDGFELGADDYVVKPFLPKELLLRVEAIMKRVYPAEKRIITLEHATIDLDSAQVHRNGQVLSLTAKEYDILVKLAENAGNIITIGVLCQTACGKFWQGYESTLMTHIRHIREKIELEPSKPVSLITVKGIGYKLNVK